MHGKALQRDGFVNNPAAYITQAIKDYVAGSPFNRMPAYDGERIWDEPLVAFADGDDTLFEEYKRIIGDFHMTPREVLRYELGSLGLADARDLSRVSVICWVLPSTEETRLSMREETVVPSLRWNHTRWHGQDLNMKLSKYVVSLVEGMGYDAASPELMKSYQTRDFPDGPRANWSYRHAAHAAGLGTFSLNDALITPKGIAVRLGTVVCNMSIPASPRPYASHVSNCLHLRNGSCGKCIERCPAGAIAEDGHDKVKCREFLFGRQIEILKQMGRTAGYLGRYYGCGLCQTGVPCEGGIPQ